jgi:hypothetical protein
VICHAGGLHIQLLDDLIQEVAQILNITIDWDTETFGCIGRTNRPLNTTFAEIASWFVNPKNSKEFTIFMFDDQMDLQSWDKVHLLVNAIHAYFGKKVFTPIDKLKFFPTRWPSLSELNTKGKNIMFVSRTNYGAEMNSTIFNRDDIWNESAARDPWKPFPTCTSGNLVSQRGTHLSNSKVCSLCVCVCMYVCIYLYLYLYLYVCYSEFFIKFVLNFIEKRDNYESDYRQFNLWSFLQWT